MDTAKALPLLYNTPDFKLDLNFDRLKDLFLNIREEYKAIIKANAGLIPNLEWGYADRTVHYEMFDALLSILKCYRILEHINELYYTVIILNDNCQVAQEIQDEAYNNSNNRIYLVFQYGIYLN